MKQGIFMRPMSADAAEANIDIIGVIGWEMWYADMRAMIESIPASVNRVVFHIFSPGGDVWEGNGIVQAIGELGKRAQTVAHVQVAASMATLIAVACNEREIAQNGRFLIHNAWAGVTGDAAELEKMAKTLRDCEAEAAKFYASRTGKTEDEMRALMNEERWLMPEEAMSIGFVQKVCDPFKPEEYAAVRQEIEAAGKWPKALVEIPQEQVKEEGDATKADVGSVPAESAEQDQPAESKNEEDAAAFKAEYDRGVADGEAAGYARGLTELTEQVEELRRKHSDAEKLASKYQGERDKNAAQLVACQKASDERAAALRDEIKVLSERLQKHVAGSLTFTPPIETWEDAMRSCGGDYAKAAKQYPNLLKQYRYNAAQRQKETK